MRSWCHFAPVCLLEISYSLKVKHLGDLIRDSKTTQFVDHRPPLPPEVAAGGHGGSAGQITNEFILSIIEEREPLVDIYEAIAMTAPGIVAHQSAMKDGEQLKIPQFDPQRKG